MQACRSLHLAFSLASSVQPVDWWEKRVEEALSFKSGWQDYSIGQLCFSSTISVQDNLQESRTIKQRRRTLSIAEHAEEKLLKPAIHEYISVDVLGGAEDLANLLRSELVECQISAGQKMRFSPLRPPPRHPLFHLAHNILCSGDSGFLNRNKELLYKKLREGELLLEIRCIQQGNEATLQTAASVRAAHVCNRNS